MIIDAHTHHTRRAYIDEVWWDGLADSANRARARRGEPPVDPQSHKDEYTAALEAASGDAYITTMDIAGIDYMVTAPLDYHLVFGETEVTVEQQNLEHARLAQKYPDRIIAFAGIDANRGREGLELFERLVRDEGVRGLKLHPLSGFYPDGEAAYGFFELAVQLDVPVLIHTGLDPAPLRSKYGDPIYLNDPLIDFPKLRLMAAHMAGNYTPYRDLLVQLLSMHTNLYADLSYDFGLYSRLGPADYYARLRADIDRAGPKKIAFGSDYPYVGRDGEGLARFLDIYRAVPEEIRADGIDFSEVEISNILSETALEWLGMDIE